MCVEDTFCTAHSSLNWNFDCAKWVFFSLKLNMQLDQIHLLQQVTLPNEVFSIWYHYNSVQITQIWGYWRCEQEIMRCRLTPHEYSGTLWHHNGHSCLSAYFFMQSELAIDDNDERKVYLSNEVMHHWLLKIISTMAPTSTDYFCTIIAIYITYFFLIHIEKIVWDMI